jgi:peroxiredoxin Q/BCP
LRAVLKPGDAAPDFALKDGDGRDVRLSSFRGRPVILYFYPKDHTPGCIVEAKGFRDAHPDIAAAGGVLLGVSLDDAPTHCSFRDKYSLSYPLLCDTDGRVHDLYGAWRTTLLGRNLLGVRRCTYLIDPAGVIAKAYPRVHPTRHARDVLADLRALQASEASKPLAPAQG